MSKQHIKSRANQTYVRAATAVAVLVPLAAVEGGIRAPNHNETVVRHGVRLPNHNETVVGIRRGLDLKNHDGTVVRA